MTSLYCIMVGFPSEFPHFVARQWVDPSMSGRFLQLRLAPPAFQWVGCIFSSLVSLHLHYLPTPVLPPSWTACSLVLSVEFSLPNSWDVFWSIELFSQTPAYLPTPTLPSLSSHLALAKLYRVQRVATDWKLCTFMKGFFSPLIFAVDQVKFGLPLRKVTEPYSDSVRQYWFLQSDAQLVSHANVTSHCFLVSAAALRWWLESVRTRRLTVRLLSLFLTRARCFNVSLLQWVEPSLQVGVIWLSFYRLLSARSSSSCHKALNLEYISLCGHNLTFASSKCTISLNSTSRSDIVCYCTRYNTVWSSRMPACINQKKDHRNITWICPKLTSEVTDKIWE